MPYPRGEWCVLGMGPHGAALRFQLFNEKLSEARWLLLQRGRSHGELSLGPAQVVLSDGSYKYEKGNVIVIEPDVLKGAKEPEVLKKHGKDSNLSEAHLNYKVYSDRQGGLVKEGRAAVGDVVDTGWSMGLKLRLISFFPQAKREYTYQKRDRPVEGLTTSAIEVEYRGEKRWLGLGAMTRYFLEDRFHTVSYRRCFFPLDFELELKDFRVKRYEGSLRASSYESEVAVEGLGVTKISMNRPLKHKGFTFYQSSFQQEEPGRPYMSIFSVNYDPGRYIKYLGCLLIVLGSIVLFYFKRPFKKCQI